MNNTSTFSNEKVKVQFPVFRIPRKYKRPVQNFTFDEFQRFDRRVFVARVKTIPYEAPKVVEIFTQTRTGSYYNDPCNKNTIRNNQSSQYFVHRLESPVLTGRWCVSGDDYACSCAISAESNFLPLRRDCTKLPAIARTVKQTASTVFNGFLVKGW